MRKDIFNVISELKGVKSMINKSELARRFGCSINTVNKYLEVQNSEEKIKRKYSSKLDEYKGIIDKTQDTLFECIMHACNEISGVPNEILFDNMATVVDRLSSTYRTVVINKKFAKHKYSVPIKYIGEYLIVKENEDTLNIYYTTDLIASHKISREIFKL